jgi:hypothetical protein
MTTNIFRKHSLDCFASLAMTMLLCCPAAAQTPNLKVCANQGFSLVSTEDADGIKPITYTWYENGTPIYNSNTTSLSFSAGKATPGIYQYVRKASNAACTELPSNTYTVEVLAPPVPTNASANSRECSGMVTFSATVPEAYTIDWYDAPIGGNFVAGSVTSFSPTISSSTTYYAQARHATAGCVSTTRLPVGATVSPASTITRTGGDASQTVNSLSNISAITYTATGATSIALSSGSFPPGVVGTANGSVFTISGRAVYAGAYSYTITASSTVSCPAATAQGTFTVVCPPSGHQVTYCNGISYVYGCPYEGAWPGFADYCASLGDGGWRMPTTGEIQCLCQGQDNILDWRPFVALYTDGYYLNGGTPYHGEVISHPSYGNCIMRYMHMGEIQPGLCVR